MDANTILSSLVSALISSGILLFIGKAVIREVLRDDIKRIEDKISRVEKDYVTCAYCATQNEHTTGLFKSIDSKLEILIEHNMS